MEFMKEKAFSMNENGPEKNVHGQLWWPCWPTRVQIICGSNQLSNSKLSGKRHGLGSTPWYVSNFENQGCVEKSLGQVQHGIENGGFVSR